jgi:hypothetical protein
MSGHLLHGTANKHIELGRSFKRVAHLNTNLRMQLDLVFSAPHCQRPGEIGGTPGVG